MEGQLVEFLGLVYSATPSNVLTSWGISRYNCFKNKCWKHLEESSNLFQFVNKYFTGYDSSLSAIISFLDDQDNLPEMFRYLNDNITILVGRLQFTRLVGKPQVMQDVEEGQDFEEGQE